MPRTTARFLIVALVSIFAAYLSLPSLATDLQNSAQTQVNRAKQQSMAKLLIAATDQKVAAASTTSSASELANGVAGAYGGMVKIKEMLNRGTRSHGFIKNLSTISSATNVFECEFVNKGNKVRIEMEFLGQSKIEVFNGKRGWIQQGDWVSKADDKTVERISEEMQHGLNALEKLDDLTYQMEVLPAKIVNGKSCDVLKLTSPEGKWTILYIDPLKRLVMRSEFMGLDSEQGIEALKATEYSDYRDVMGFPTPYKINEFIAGKPSQEATLDGITIDDTIDNSLFEMPEESRFGRLDRGPVTVPFDFIGNYIVIDARVSNGPDAKFVIDTGASQTVIDKATAQALGPITTHTFSVTALAKAMPLGYTKLDKLQIGDLSIENVPTLVTDLSTLTAAIGQRPAGLIGANILNRFLLTIDFQDRKLTFADPHTVRIPEGGIIIPTSPVFASTGLVVSGILDQKPMNFLVDTGAAFNLLPASLASAFNTGATLPVGQINGIEGQKTSFGSVKFNNLKLAGYSVPNPVFAIQPEKAIGGTSGGLSSASGMGILGNPIWSKTRLNIDYRNDRLIIEIPADRQKLDKFIEQINDTQRNYLRSKNIDAAANEFDKIMTAAQHDGVKAAEALALAHISSLYADRFLTLKESRWLDMAGKEYERAAKLAAESRNKNIEGQILAEWAMLYLNAPRSNTDLISTQNLLKKALARSPMDSNIYAALGSAMLRTSNSPDLTPDERLRRQQTGVKFVDQALIYDPSNWQALTEKFKLYESEHKIPEMKLVLSQMTRYYSDFPQLKDMQAKINKLSGQSAQAPGASHSGRPGAAHSQSAAKSGSAQSAKSNSAQKRPPAK